MLLGAFQLGEFRRVLGAVRQRDQRLFVQTHHHQRGFEIFRHVFLSDGHLERFRLLDGAARGSLFVLDEARGAVVGLFVSLTLDQFFLLRPFDALDGFNLVNRVQRHGDDRVLTLRRARQSRGVRRRHRHARLFTLFHLQQRDSDSRTRRLAHRARHRRLPHDHRLPILRRRVVRHRHLIPGVRSRVRRRRRHLLDLSHPPVPRKIPMTRKRQQLHVKHQRRVRRNLRRRPSFPVRVIPTTRKRRAFADPHGRHADVPRVDHAMRPEREFKRFFSFSRRIERRPVLERPRVMHANDVVRLRRGRIARRHRGDGFHDTAVIRRGHIDRLGRHVFVRACACARVAFDGVSLAFVLRDRRSSASPRVDV